MVLPVGVSTIPSVLASLKSVYQTACIEVGLDCVGAIQAALSSVVGSIVDSQSDLESLCRVVDSAELIDHAAEQSEFVAFVGAAT